MQTNEIFTSSAGSFSLERIPKIPRDTLRAWDAADELLINHIFEESLLPITPEKNQINTLIINDSFGALTVALHPLQRDNWSDSFVSHLAAKSNMALNFENDSEDNLHFIPSTESLNKKYNVVLIKIPKTLSLLEDQLYHLKPHITEETQIIAAAMSKHIHTSTLKLFEKIIGTTVTSRASKKARLVFAKNDITLRSRSPYPTLIQDKTTGLELINHANVFSKDKLDIGTRFFIEHLSKCPQAEHIIDLACGNGALGIVIQKLQPKAKICFLDESYNAVASAKANMESTRSIEDNLSYPSSDFYIGNSLNNFQGDNAQLILCNPPFHQAHSIGDHLAWDMFKQSRKYLDKNGEIWIVGNRHLNYHVKLKKLYGNCRTIASNKKFVILAANKNQ